MTGCDYVYPSQVPKDASSITWDDFAELVISSSNSVLQMEMRQQAQNKNTNNNELLTHTFSHSVPPFTGGQLLLTIRGALQ